MRLRYIDVIKAIAIIMVVLYHSGFAKYGYLGVDVFLVISGYLTTKGLRRNLLESPISYGGYLGFERNRVIRLLPLLLLAGIVCMLLGYYLMLPDDYENLSESVVATNFFGNNILAAITVKDYWNVVNDYKPLMHTWYVGLIMQFYLIYPIVFYIARLDRNRPQRTLLYLLSFITVLSITVYFLTVDVAQRFYYLPSRLYEFTAGGLVAMLWKPEEGKRVFPTWVVFASYLLLIFLMAVNAELIPALFKLPIVVVLTVILIMSGKVLENSLTTNSILAKIGAASYSVFVWHQIVLAFYRYSISNHFTIASYSICIVLVALLSWVTYCLIEQKVTIWVKDSKKKTYFYIIIALAFLGLTAFSSYIYLHAGVVRDVPELYISKNDIHRGLHSEYNDRVYEYDKPFETEKKHWLVIGNSFGRDFCNMIFESPINEIVEVSYIFEADYKKPSYEKRFSTADKVFFSTLGISEEKVVQMERQCARYGLSPENLIIVGEKNFGENNGQFYINRNKPDYFEQRTTVNKDILNNNKLMKSICKEQYLDILSFVMDENNMVPVFTPDHHFISQDCNHLSKGGAIWLGQLVDWEKYLK